MCDTWPPIDDVLRAGKRLEPIPIELDRRIAERYREHGREYTGADIMEIAEGRLQSVNLCMSKDNLADVEEEIVDAIFNTLILCYRRALGDVIQGGGAAKLLRQLLDTWRLCAVLQRSNRPQERLQTDP